MRLSILTPAFNERANLEALHTRLADAADRLGLDWDWLVVDDHSTDDTFAVVERLATADPRVSGLRLARNSGSHAAIACGLHHVRGDAALMLAADLQDPPETLAAMLDARRRGAQVVWAVRRTRPGRRRHAGFAALYYWIMRHVVGMKEMPARGADFFLIDRPVIEAFCRFPERNLSVFALITWLGFTQAYVEYDKQPRARGQSGWTLARKIRLVVDSITAFSDLPIRLVSALGLALLGVGTVAAAAGIFRWSTDVGGWLLLLGVLAALGGLQLVAIGVVGEYVARGLDEARRRPLYVVERRVGCATSEGKGY